MKGWTNTIFIAGVVVIAMYPIVISASRPPYHGDDPVAQIPCYSYRNSICDTSGPTFTCQDVACHDTGSGGVPSGSEKFVSDKNVTMLACKHQVNSTCRSNKRECGNFYRYWMTGCAGSFEETPGYQYDCSL